METFVRDELLEIIGKKCECISYEFEHQDWKYFFGVYDTDSTKFRFMRGDTTLVKELVKFVNEKASENPNYFKPSTQRKIFLNDTIKLPIGTYFARKERTIELTATASCLMSESEAKTNFFETKIKPLFEKYAQELTLVHQINEDGISIVNNGKNVYADVKCVFCENAKPLRVQGNVSVNFDKYYWNSSNMEKHMALHKKWVTKEENEHDEDEASESLPDDRMDLLKQLAIKEEERNQVTPLRQKRRQIGIKSDAKGVKRANKLNLKTMGRNVPNAKPNSMRNEPNIRMNWEIIV